jgi:hypothetical protein
MPDSSQNVLTQLDERGRPEHPKGRPVISLTLLILGGLLTTAHAQNVGPGGSIRPVVPAGVIAKRPMRPF